ncbi:MAG TPA: YfhO family protein [Thermomicrobiales bacterium]|nr:YfhO family protein [Thermomicrobiales bacterium]
MLNEEQLETPSSHPWWRTPLLTSPRHDGRNRPDTIAIAILLVLTAVVMWQRWVYDNWLARHDLLTFFLPWFGALGDRLRDLDIPALNPYIFSGSPFAGDPESGWMYFPAMLLFPFFEVTVAYKLMIALLLVLAGTSTYAFARLVGYSVLAALFSAIAFQFGPFLFGQTDCCTVGTKLTAFLPLAFLGVEISLRAKAWPYRAAGWVIAGLAISQMFAAWLGQGVVNALLLIAAWIVFRTIITPPDFGWDRRERLIRLFTTGPAVLVLGVGLAAAGLLPRLAANQESNNPGGTYEHTPGSRDYALHTLASALKTILVDAHGYRGTSVWGIVFVLMVLAPFLSRRTSVIPFFSVVAVVIPALAMGLPLVSDFFYLLPFYEEMHTHSPGRVFWIYPFIPAMLAGAAINELWRLPGLRYKWIISFVPFVVVCIAALLIGREQNVDPGFWMWATAILATIVILFIAAAPVLPDKAARQRLIQGPLVLLVALTFLLPNGIDLVRTVRADTPEPGELVMWANDPWMQGIIEESLSRDDPGGAGEFLQAQDGPFRFIAYGGMYHPDTVRQTYPSRRLEPSMIAILQNARPMRLHLETTQGYNPLQPMVYMEFIAALNRDSQDYHYANLTHTGVNSPLLDLLDVRYIVVDRNIPEDRRDHLLLAEIRTEVFRNDEVIIYESPTVTGRAWMVYDVRADDGAGLDQLASGEVSGATVAFVDGEAPATATPADASTTQVTATGWTPDSRAFSVSQEGAGLLVVSEIWSENWTATVDGEPVEVLQTDHALIGVPVGPGEHAVEVHYAPESLTLGMWVSVAAGAGSVAILVYAGWLGLQRRRHAAHVTTTTTGAAA